MGAYDKNLIMRDGTVNLTATENGGTSTTLSGGKRIIDIGAGGTPAAGLNVRVEVPQATGTSPTLDLVIEASDDSFTNTKEKYTLPQITAAGSFVVPFSVKRRYLRHNATVGGTTPNFGGVVIGVDTGDPRTAR